MSAEEHNANHYENEILGILRSRKSPKVIRDELSDYHANDIAEVLPELSARERQMLYRLLSDDDLAGVFEHTDDAVTYLSELDPKKAEQTLEAMEPDTAVDILKTCQGQQKQAWIELMSEDARNSLHMLATYSEDQIGSRMTTNFVTLHSNQTIKEAMNSIVAQVVDDEMGEDYAKLGGLSAEEDLNEPLKKSVQKRLPWLILLLGLGMIVSSVVSLFEAVVAQLTVVMIFQSLILDMSGNVGTQSLAVTIRVLMDEKLTGKEKAHLVWKECRVGFTNGLFLGLLAFGGIGVYIMAAKHLAVASAFAISGCIGISLVVAMLISSLVGTVIPLFFKQIGVDPAVASGPLITTVTDMVGVVTYYGLAWLFLIEMLHM